MNNNINVENNNAEANTMMNKTAENNNMEANTMMNKTAENNNTKAETMENNNNMDGVGTLGVVPFDDFAKIIPQNEQAVMEGNNEQFKIEVVDIIEPLEDAMSEIPQDEREGIEEPPVELADITECGFFTPHVWNERLHNRYRTYILGQTPCGAENRMQHYISSAI